MSTSTSRWRRIERALQAKSAQARRELLAARILATDHLAAGAGKEVAANRLSAELSMALDAVMLRNLLAHLGEQPLLQADAARKLEAAAKCQGLVRFAQRRSHDLAREAGFKERKDELAELLGRLDQVRPRQAPEG